MTDISIRILLLEFVDANGASHIRELHIEILRHKPNTPEHTVRARLSEAVSDGLLDWLREGVVSLTLDRYTLSQRDGDGLRRPSIDA